MSKQKLSIKKGLEQSNRVKFEDGESRIAYATEAYHKLGNISRQYGDSPKLESTDFEDVNRFWEDLKGGNGETTKELSEHLCIIESYDDEYYYGSWVTGFGYFDVKFPKTTTRALTEDEINEMNEMNFAINNQPSWNLKGYKKL